MRVTEINKKSLCVSNKPPCPVSLDVSNKPSCSRSKIQHKRRLSHGKSDPCAEPGIKEKKRRKMISSTPIWEHRGNAREE